MSAFLFGAGLALVFMVLISTTVTWLMESDMSTAAKAAVMLLAGSALMAAGLVLQ